MNTIATHPGHSKESPFKKYIWPSWAQRKRMLYTETWVFLAASYLLLAFSYLWPTDFRNNSTGYVVVAWFAFMVRVFLFHLGLVVVVIAGVAGIWRRWRLLGACVPFLAITLGPVWWPFSRHQGFVNLADTFTVMSVNLLMVNENCAPLISEIKATEPDILLLQEYTVFWHEALQEAIGTDYPYESHVCREDSFGTAVYSRHPFIGRAKSWLPLGHGDVPQTRTVIDVSGRQVAVYNIHLLPPRRLDYTIEHRTQWADLLNLLANETLPMIVGGDFNFTEQSPQAAAISRIGFTDAHAAAGRGRGATWPVLGRLRYVPGLRLDHIYLGRGLIPMDCRTGIGKGSDHRPVIVKVRCER